MNFDMQTFVGSALMGVGQRYSKNYDAYKKEQMDIAAEQRRYQTDLMKEQELYTRSTARQQQERKAKADYMRESGQYSDAEIAAVESGAELSQQYQDDRALDLEGRKQDLITDKTLSREDAIIRGKIERANPNASPEEIDAEVARYQSEELGRLNKTAAEQNAMAIEDILKNVKKDDQGNPIYTPQDKIMLSVFGVKIPEKERLKLDADNHVKIQENSFKYGEDMWGDPDKVSDVDVVNYMNQNLPEGRKPFKPSDAPRVRQMLVRQTSRDRYIFSVTNLTGAPPSHFPDGSKITDDQVDSAINNVLDEVEEAEASGDGGTYDQWGSTKSIRMEGDPEDLRGIDKVRYKREQIKKRKQGPGGQTIAWGEQGMGTTEPTGPSNNTAVPRPLPKPGQTPTAMTGGPRGVDDIINRMNN